MPLGSPRKLTNTALIMVYTGPNMEMAQGPRIPLAPEIRCPISSPVKLRATRGEPAGLQFGVATAVSAGMRLGY